jgi:hypothetical protein
VRNPAFQTVRGTEEQLYQVNNQSTRETVTDLSPDKKNPPSKFRVIPISVTKTVNVDSNDDREVVVTKLNTKKEKKSTEGKKKKTKITVIVEDASDSEYEDDFKSLWRNRRPSPGQWMEPVENFQ